MSAPDEQYCSDNDNDPQSTEDNENSSDGAYHEEIDRTQFSADVSYHSDAQRRNVDPVRFGPPLKEKDADIVPLIQRDAKQRSAPTALALAALSSQQEAEHHSGSSSGFNIGQHPDRSSSLHESRDMFPPLNRAYMLHRDFLRPPSGNNNNNNTNTDGVGASPTAFPYEGVHFSDDVLCKNQTQAQISGDIYVDSATHSFSAAIRRYIDDAKPQAPSSVKSFGSNVGSDDCGGSLDVETHSIGARSVHSQEDILPVVMPDPDPETVAVASLSIDPVENGELRSFVGSMYKNFSPRQQHSRYMHLPLQRFHNNPVQLGNLEDRGVEDNVETTAVGNDSHSFSSRHDDHRTPLNWNDPRIDNDKATMDSSRRQIIDSTRNTPRSRSRSRSPPL